MKGSCRKTEGLAEQRQSWVRFEAGSQARVLLFVRGPACDLEKKKVSANSNWRVSQQQPCTSALWSYGNSLLNKLTIERGLVGLVTRDEQVVYLHPLVKSNVGTPWPRCTALHSLSTACAEPRGALAGSTGELVLGPFRVPLHVHRAPVPHTHVLMRFLMGRSGD